MPAQPKLVVGVGASAGGLEAFRQLLLALPPDTGMTFLLVQHLDPTHKSLLPELLGPCTRMAVHDADQGRKLQPDTVYIIRPDTALAVSDGKIELSEPTLHRGVRLPVDHLFRSLARDYGDRAVGIVLSGAGSDGSAGLRDIKAKGGLTIAQDPGSSGQSGMPQSAIDTGVVDLVLEIDQLPAALERFANLPDRAQIQPDQVAQEEKPERLTSLDEDDLRRLAALLEAQLGFDLCVYKRATVERRLLRRLALSGFDGLEQYFEHLCKTPAEQQTLVRDLLISVTEFFRDPGAFTALRTSVIEPLVARAQPGATLRAWVPGCATGEEAYSLGIEFLDAIQKQNKRITLQVFATDIDQDALAVARAATYPASIVEHVSEQRIKHYFKPLNGKGYQVRSFLRDVVSFAVHDLTKDPPFSRIHLVSCRNVLIYLTSEAQKHVLEVLHFALEPQGYLFLSTSETTGPQRHLFSTISKSQRIYTKVGASKPIAVPRSRNRLVLDHEKALAAPAVPRAHRAPGESELARRAALKACMPPTIVVSNGDNVVYTQGELSPYLTFPQDDGPRFELSSLLRPEIATRTRAALYKCRRNNETVVALSSLDSPSRSRVRITARPAEGLSDDAVVLNFEAEAAKPAEPVQGVESPEQDAVIEQLEKELQATQEDLRTTVEELESSNEELRSSNEESMSMNEELQSANEELEATTEELRSLNEELTTVNAQLREKVEQLEQAHDDLNNFFASTKIATIFLDERLCIKRLTPAARELLGIAHADVGRAITDIARELLQQDLQAESRAVLDDFSVRSRELRTKDGRWISRQVLPYRTENRHIEGVVVTFVDVTPLKSATERLELRERQQSVIAQLGLLALRETELQPFFDRVVGDVQEALDTDFTKLLELQPGENKLSLRAGIGWEEDQVGAAVEPGGTGSPAGYALRSQAPVVIDDVSTERRFAIPPLLEAHGVVSGLSCAVRYGDHRYGVLGAYAKTRRHFSAEDEHFAQAVANVVGSAIGRYQARARLALELGVTQVLADATGLDETLDLLLQRMTSEIGPAVVAERWWPNGNKLSRRRLHVAPPADRQRVERHLQATPITRGTGVVSRVHDEQRAVWISELGNPKLFVRAQAAKALGLSSGLAFPIRAGNERLGVIALFSIGRMLVDQDYLRSLEAIGRAVGDFIARWQADDAVRQLAAITESSQDAILIYRLDGTVTKWLAGAEQLFGYSADEIVGQSIDCIVPEDRREELRSAGERISRGERVEPFETVRIAKDGKLLEVSVRSAAVKSRHGKVVEISSTDRDISHLKETEHQLREADRQKDEFIAMLGHELRNPLAAIRTASDLLEAKGCDAEAVARAQPIIERQTAHMAKLLEGLLDVSRISRGKIELEKGIVDLANVCREVCSDHIEQFSQQSAPGFRSELPSEPVWVEGDAVRLRQIVDNLLSNAVKYTSPGGLVTLGLSREDGEAVLRVRDTGTGIEPELLPHVFEVFRQSGQSLDRSRGGLGLGLAITKLLVELHGGSVDARSDGRGKGAEFVVRLPASEPQEVRPSAAKHTDGQPLRLLIIDDNEDAAEVLEEVLELEGHTVFVAHDGIRGIEMAKQHKPDVVLCDLGLPDNMTGFDVARALRSDPDLKGTRLISHSGYGRPEDKERGGAAGFDAHLTKPVDTQSLINTIARLRSRASSA